MNIVFVVICLISYTFIGACNYNNMITSFVDERYLNSGFFIHGARDYDCLYSKDYHRIIEFKEVILNDRKIQF